MRDSAVIFLRFLVGALVLVSAGSIHAHPSGAYFDEGLIRVDATVDSQSASLFYDTGASSTVFFSAGAKRLGIPAGPNKDVAIAGEKVASEISEEVDISMFGLNSKSRFLILPLNHRHDGVLGWRSVRKPLLIDGVERKIQMLDQVPPSDGWQQWTLDKDTSQLFFTVTEGGQTLGRVFVDTGIAGGLRLSPALWKEWKARNPDRGITLESFRYSVGEPLVSEIGWSEQYRLGDLVFHNVDIGSIPSANDGVAKDMNGKEFIATIGMGALRHLRLMVSSGTAQFWTQSVSGIPPHNRLGAVFLPDPNDGTRLACQVLPKSPAAKAGLLDGDVFLEIQGIGASGTNQRDIARLEKAFSQPAGTGLELLVKRGDATVKVKVELKDLLD